MASNVILFNDGSAAAWKAPSVSEAVAIYPELAHTVGRLHDAVGVAGAGYLWIMERSQAIRRFGINGRV